MDAKSIERFRKVVSQEIDHLKNSFAEGKIAKENYERKAGQAQGLSRALELFTACTKKENEEG